MDQIRLGVVGTGLIWEHTHLPILSSMPERFAVKALCVSKPERAPKWEARCPGACVYTDYRALVEDSEIDAVLVATPIGLNPEVTIAALRAGKHVFEEKPIATTAEQAQAVLRAQRQSGKNVYMLEQLLYDPKICDMRRRIQEKSLGTPVFFEMLTHFILDPEDDPTVGYSRTPWRMNPDFPLGAIFDGGAHDFAILTSLFGLPRTLYSTGAELRSGMGKYDHILTAFSFDGGLSGFHSHSAYLGGSNNYFNVRFTGGSIYSQDGALVIERRSGEQERVAFAPCDAYRLMWEALARAYHGAGDIAFTAEEAARSVRVFDAIVRSLDEGRSVEVEGARA